MNTNDPARPVNHDEELSDMPTNKDAPRTSAGQLRIIEPAESNWHDPIIYRRPRSRSPRASILDRMVIFRAAVYHIYSVKTRKEMSLIRLRFDKSLSQSIFNNIEC